MTNKIKILSAEQALKIAAGEVIERPTNIIKELLENSIDAGATKIMLKLHQAGKKSITIIDNGSGMTPEDAQLSVAQHATSKISSVDDLEKITTFGFRGEALASINAVSNVSITTKTESAQTGIAFTWKFGTLQNSELTSHPTGTTITITNLFDNIPARQKFLKKDETEWRSIVTLFQAFCFDYPAIHFQLYHDDALYLNCPATPSLIDRARQVFDRSIHDRLLTLESMDNATTAITGIISRSDYYRYDRNQIFIFVNQRWVKNIDLTKAIMKGYAGTLPVQKFPAAILFITINPEQVDINIHPKKEEVKFLHPKKLEAQITTIIKATLDGAAQKIMTTATPKFIAAEQDHTFAFLKPDTSIQKSYEPLPEQLTLPSFPLPKEKEKKETIFFDHSITAPTFAPLAQAMPEPRATMPHEQKTVHAMSDITIIGQYKKTYIIFENDTNLVFIDQHAAHERILYEQFKSHFYTVPTIQLMFPEFIALQAKDITTLTPYLSLLKEHGIIAETFSETQIIIQATPVHLKNQLCKEILQEIIGWIHQEPDMHDTQRIATILHEKMHTKMACSAAIKAGESLNHEQMYQLLEQLQQTEHKFSCPHGRPTFWHIGIDQIEKQFKRDYGKKSDQLYNFL